jgi:long-subunit acyl-CoA synthetase (AMP-forming)
MAFFFFALLLFPRTDLIGELWVKADSNSPGYFKDDENNAKSYDKDGYFCTGDIVEYNQAKYVSN